MQRYLKYILCGIALVIVLAFSACVSKADYEKLQKDSMHQIGELQTQLTNIKTEFSSTSALLASTGKSLAATQSELKTTHDQLDVVSKQLVTKQSELKASQENLDNANRQLAAAQAEIKSTKLQLDAVNQKIQLYQDTTGITVYAQTQPNYRKTPSPTDKILLANNQAAKDPTWQQLVNFIAADDTDKRIYIPDVFMCGGFAEQLHNKAEAAGIRSAIVFAEFANSSTGHALNAFRTSDKGLVYIDCTGRGLQTVITESATGTWDKMAYLAKGKEYGLLALNMNDSADYSFYLTNKALSDAYVTKLGVYNQDVRNFNSEVTGHVYYIGTPDWYRMKEWESLLDKKYRELLSLKSTIVPDWQSLGILSSIAIYW